MAANNAVQDQSVTDEATRASPPAAQQPATESSPRGQMNFTIRERLRYRFDAFMSRGSSSSFVALTVVFLTLFAVVALARAITVALIDDPIVERGDSFWRQIWIAFLEMTDPGSMTQDIDSGPMVKIFAVIAGMAGLVLLSALIAVITTALDQRLAALRKGHSKVVLEDHSVILGWNERIVDVLRELILANESEDDAAVVILADKDKEEMDDFLALNLPERLTTKVVTRSGEISSLVNLGVVSIDTSRSIMILSSAPTGAKNEDLERSDMTAVKTVLGVKGALGDRDVPIVVEVFDERKRELARSIDPDRVVAVDADDMLAKILVQTSRNEGLAVVYEEMLSFDGAEIYLYEPEQAFSGERFADIAYRIPDGVPLGFVDSEGVRLNPPGDTVLEGDVTLVILSSDDSMIEVAETPVCRPDRFTRGMSSAEQTWERELIIGWTAKLPTIIREYGDYVVEGSEIDIVLREPDPLRAIELEQLAAEVPSLKLRILEANPRNAEDLLTLRPFEYNNIIVLSEAGQVGAAEWADSETLVFLLQLQQIFRDHGDQTKTKLIAEILESRNRELITGTGVREFVISNRLVSMVMSQISEEQEMSTIYEDLFSEAGSEVYLKPLHFYIGDPPESLTFGDVMEACFTRNELAIGIRRASRSEDPNSNFGVELIPDKNSPVLTADILSIVVLAEDEA